MSKIVINRTTGIVTVSVENDGDVYVRGRDEGGTPYSDRYAPDFARVLAFAILELTDPPELKAMTEKETV